MTTPITKMPACCTGNCQQGRACPNRPKLPWQIPSIAQIVARLSAAAQTKE